MRRVLLLAVLAAAALLAPPRAEAGRLTPMYAGGPVYGVPLYGGVPFYPPYGWVVPGAPVYVAPPAFIGGPDDPDHRDIRYNRYFQRHQPPPQIRGYTFR